MTIQFVGPTHVTEAAFLCVTAGTQGSASYWAAQLLRMYLKYCERRQWQYVIVDPQSSASHRGKVVIAIPHEDAYDRLRNETGYHRITRQHPEMPDRRQTLYAYVEFADSLSALTGSAPNNGRIYVMSPYKLVKDLRSNYETADVDAVLGGDLDGFIEASK